MKPRGRGSRKSGGADDVDVEHPLVADEHVRSAVRAVSVFSELSEELREELIANSTLRRLPAREWLFRQDDEGDALYVVSSGRLEVVRERPGPPTVIRVLGSGAAVGELALLTDSPRSAGARAIRDSELLRVGRDQVLTLLNDSAPFAIALTRTLGRLLQVSGSPPLARRPGLGVIAVVPAQGRAAVRDFSDQLLHAIGRSGSATLLEHGELDDQELEPDAAFAAYGRALDRREREHDYVILVGAGQQDRAWNAFCTRQADRVVAVAQPAAASRPSARSPDLEGSDLVLWGPPHETSRHVGVFLDGCRPRAHHFVDSGRGFTADVEKLARRLLGRSVGIVLSGGGAGGLAHIGVLETLVEGGVQIDRVGGCSFGAFVGALFALGRRPDEIAATCREQLVARKPFNDYALPRRSFIRGRKAHAMLRLVFGDVDIEQLPLDLFCVSSDLLSAEVVVHRRGPLADAVRASASVPGLIQPMRHAGRLLVDGGVLNNFPVDIMAATGEGPIIAVDVMGRRLHRPRAVPVPGAPEDTHASGADDLPLPAIHEVLARVTALGSWRSAARVRAEAEVVVAPDLRGFGMFDFKRLDAIVEAGRSSARSSLAQAQTLSG